MPYTSWTATRICARRRFTPDSDDSDGDEDLDLYALRLHDEAAHGKIHKKTSQLMEQMLTDKKAAQDHVFHAARLRGQTKRKKRKEKMRKRVLTPDTPSRVRRESTILTIVVQKNEGFEPSVV